MEPNNLKLVRVPIIWTVNHSSWLTGLVSKFSHCGFNLQNENSESNTRAAWSIPTSLHHSPRTHTATEPPSISLEPPQLYASRNRNCSYLLGWQRPMGSLTWAQRGSHLFLLQVTHSQPDSSKQSQFCVLFQPLLASSRHVGRLKNSGWLITIFDPLRLTCSFFKNFPICLPAASVHKCQWNVSTICLLVIWVSDEKCI